MTAAQQALVVALSPDLDWDCFIQLALQHGVAALVYPNLKKVLADVAPDEIVTRLQRHAIDNTQSNLRMIGALREVMQELKSQQIDFALFKGLSISQLVYRDFSVRKCGDIDLLIRKRDFQRAKAIFLALGFRQTLTDEAEADYLQSGLWHEQRRLQIDLHWGIPPSALGINAGKLLNSLMVMPIGGVSVPVFSPADLFISLCVNAVKEYGNQLLYPYCDIREFLSSDVRINWSSLPDRAEALGCRCSLEAALGVVKQLFDIELPAALANALDPHSPAGLISRELLSQVFEKDASGSTIIHQESGRHLYYFRSHDDYLIALMDSPWRRFAYRNLRFIQPNAADRALVKLPDGLSLLYYLIRPVRLAGKQGRQLVGRLIGRTTA